MAILTDSGRTAIAKSIAAQAVHFAWGSGLASWDTTRVAESSSQTALVAEVGRRAAASIQYVTPDDVNGDIVVPVFNDAQGNTIKKKFVLSANPTPHLYMKFNFDFEDAPTATIREVAVIVGTVTQTGLPAGQKYFTPAQITNVGTLLAVENLLEKILRSPNSRQSFEFVITI